MHTLCIEYYSLYTRWCHVIQVKIINKFIANKRRLDRLLKAIEQCSMNIKTIEN